MPLNDHGVPNPFLNKCQLYVSAYLLTLDLIESDIDIDKIWIVNATSHQPKTVDEAYDRILSKSIIAMPTEKTKRILPTYRSGMTLNSEEMALALIDH
jgi:hypothetical protein